MSKVLEKQNAMSRVCYVVHFWLFSLVIMGKLIAGVSE